ncbi:hypothetical protein A2856_02455 [Candidatus Uhrbacteria bacterium RIFCSPHIGHO2_01_FULL_63_20]|uniref:Uncharacterized protein n=1 Tax=Candidatus Uhrbacteria bacterium RIFCSPHIGHO2_01_FULL_63_20 TaxID=1802385 RepID=A0A1F7TKN6_9BACT|nr:MAG: hypothetical protein A2856_02455 [Candidatus Uhrbacteria bacterium RIFCSPHIGHO2_01_FULL_63_20]
MDMKCPTCPGTVPDVPAGTIPGLCPRCVEGFRIQYIKHQKDRKRRAKPLADVLSRHLRQGTRKP